MDEEETDKNEQKTENLNRNKENRRQIIDFVADKEISDVKSISKAIGLKLSRTRDYLGAGNSVGDCYGTGSCILYLCIIVMHNNE